MIDDDRAIGQKISDEDANMEDGSCTFADVDRMNSNSLTTLRKNQFMRSDLILHDVKKF